MGKYNAPSKPRFEGPKEIPSAGMHPARLLSIVDLGTHTENDKDGIPKDRFKVKLTWELDELMKDGRPFVVSKDYILSASKFKAGEYFLSDSSDIKKMMIAVLGMSDKDATINNMHRLIDVPCLVSVVHKPKRDDPSVVYANLGGVNPCLKGMTVNPLVNKPQIFELGKSINEPGEGFDELPEWIQGRILSCLEFNGGVPPRIVDPKTAGNPDDVPF